MSDYPIEILNLTLRTQNCLKRAGIKYISEVASKSKAELMKYRTFGERMYNELQEKLNSFNPNIDIKKLIYDEYDSITNEPYFPYLKATLYGAKSCSLAKSNNMPNSFLEAKIIKLRKKLLNYVIKTKLIDYYDSSKKALQIELADSEWLVIFIEETVAKFGYNFLAR